MDWSVGDILRCCLSKSLATTTENQLKVMTDSDGICWFMSFLFSNSF